MLVSNILDQIVAESSKSKLIILENMFIYKRYFNQML